MGKIARLTNAAEEVVERHERGDINKTVLWLDSRVKDLTTRLNEEIRVNRVLNAKYGIKDD